MCHIWQKETRTFLSQPRAFVGQRQETHKHLVTQRAHLSTTTLSAAEVQPKRTEYSVSNIRGIEIVTFHACTQAISLSYKTGELNTVVIVILYPGLVNTQTLTAGRTRLYTYKHTTFTLKTSLHCFYGMQRIQRPLIHHRLHKEGKHNQQIPQTTDDLRTLEKDWIKLTAFVPLCCWLYFSKHTKQLVK